MAGAGGPSCTPRTGVDSPSFKCRVDSKFSVDWETIFMSPSHPGHLNRHPTQTHPQGRSGLVRGRWTSRHVTPPRTPTARTSGRGTLFDPAPSLPRHSAAGRLGGKHGSDRLTLRARSALSGTRPPLDPQDPTGLARRSQMGRNGTSPVGAGRERVVTSHSKPTTTCSGLVYTSTSPQLHIRPRHLVGPPRPQPVTPGP